MTAEMLVDQSHLQAEQQWRRGRSEDLLAALLGEHGGSQRLIDEAHQLGLKPHLKRTPYLLELDADGSAPSLAEWLREQFPDSWCSSPSPQLVSWCCPANLAVEVPRLCERLQTRGWPVLRIVSGMATEDVHGLRRGCQRVAQLLAYGQAIKPQARELSLHHLRLPALLWTHREQDTLRELLSPLQRIQAKDSNGQLLRTLRSWCEHHGQAQACAEALGIHRNSLRYRMERIFELSGKDLTRLDDLVELYMGIQLMPEQAS
jgi:carbohydrate diacid regulator